MIALIVLIIGAVVSLQYMFRAGHNQKSILLILLFATWVLLPYILLLTALFKPGRLPGLNPWVIVFLIITISLGSMLGYNAALFIPGSKTAFRFMIIPLISLLLIITVIPISRKLSNRKF